VSGDNIDPNPMQLVSRLWAHLRPRRRRQFVLVLGLMVAGALAEVASLGAVLPFLGVLVAPDKVFRYAAIVRLAHSLGIHSAAQLLLPLTIAFAVAAVAAATIRMLLLWVSIRLAFAGGADFSIEVYRRTLYQPYAVHVLRNSSVVISGITNKVLETVNVFNATLLLTSSALMLVTITIALIAIDPGVAILASVGFGVSYGLIGSFYRRRLTYNGELIAIEQTQLVKTLQEGLGGIRDVLLDGTQEVYCTTYRRADSLLRRAQANNMFIGAGPRFAMEAVGMVLIAAIAYGLSLERGGVATALPVLGTLALGAQRLLPALQQAYSSWTVIAGSKAAVVETLDLLDQPLPTEASLSTPVPLPFQQDVRF
jgi:ATP-binding cassette subfamily B protein